MIVLLIVFVVIPLIWMALQTLGSSSGELKIGPARTVTSP